MSTKLLVKAFILSGYTQSKQIAGCLPERLWIYLCFPWTQIETSDT
jgi:hypothetical protein